MSNVPAVSDPHIVYFRCWPGFDAKCGFPFPTFNALPEEEIHPKLEAAARRHLESEKGKAKLERRRWKTLRKLATRISEATYPPGTMPANIFTDMKARSFNNREPISGVEFTRRVFVLFGWMSDALGLDWIASDRQYVTRVDGPERANRATQDLQREFWNLKLKLKQRGAYVHLVPVFGHVREADLSRGDLARLLDAEKLHPLATVQDFSEECCRWAVLQHVRASKLLTLIEQGAGQVVVPESSAGSEITPKRGGTAEQLVFGSNEADVLLAIKEAEPIRLQQAEILAKVRLQSLRTIGKTLQNLETKKLVHRPDGQRRGYALTDSGRKIVAEF